ncbi:glycosyltransferase [Pedobacter aquatilis]|uniref:glycosyltransferase n=1 Tax=Pedobacter aquatilis TaxID=351343 RepID=UPI00292CB273|nr:glycosyltransferase [Pedobacter aquatilis]
MRTLVIARHLQECEVTLLGSGLSSYSGLIPQDYGQVHLPLDVPSKRDAYYQPVTPRGLHYAPMNISGQRRRVNMMTNFFSESHPILLVVDVSVEVAMLATLCGIPHIVIKQHGIRTDQAHLNAYCNAVGLIAPYPEKMKDADPKWVIAKTFFAGGISRFGAAAPASTVDQNQIAVLIGNGGSSLSAAVVTSMASACPGMHFHVIGSVLGEENFSNITYHGQLDNPAAIINRCGLVVGNAGNNTVMEIAALNKPFIVVPEIRPFQEQLVKARMLEQQGLALILYPEELLAADWAACFSLAFDLKPDWSGVVDKEAPANAAAYILERYRKHFCSLGIF